MCGEWCSGDDKRGESWTDRDTQDFKSCVLSSEIRRKPKKTKHFTRIFATLSGDFYRYPVVFNLDENWTTLLDSFQGNPARTAGILPTQSVSTKRPNGYLRRIETQRAMHDKSFTDIQKWYRAIDAGCQLPRLAISETTRTKVNTSAKTKQRCCTQ